MVFDPLSDKFSAGMTLVVAASYLQIPEHIVNHPRTIWLTQWEVNIAMQSGGDELRNLIKGQVVDRVFLWVCVGTAKKLNDYFEYLSSQGLRNIYKALTQDMLCRWVSCLPNAPEWKWRLNDESIKLFQPKPATCSGPKRDRKKRQVYGSWGGVKLKGRLKIFYESYLAVGNNDDELLNMLRRNGYPKATPATISWLRGNLRKKGFKILYSTRTKGSGPLIRNGKGEPEKQSPHPA